MILNDETLWWCHTVTHLEAHIQGQRASARCDWVETCHTSKALCRKCRNTRCHSVDIQTWLMGGVALSALLIRWHLESGVQPPRMRSEQRLMKSVWRAECWKELQGRMSMWASLCPPVCPSTVSLPLDLPLRVLKRVIVWHHLFKLLVFSLGQAQ